MLLRLVGDWRQVGFVGGAEQPSRWLALTMMMAAAAAAHDR
jgi:hypothetical protein